MSRLMLCLLVLLGGCATREPRCGAQLRPINSAAAAALAVPAREHP